MQSIYHEERNPPYGFYGLRRKGLAVRNVGEIFPYLITNDREFAMEYTERGNRHFGDKCQRNIGINRMKNKVGDTCIFILRKGIGHTHLLSLYDLWLCIDRARHSATEERTNVIQSAHVIVVLVCDENSVQSGYTGA